MTADGILIVDKPEAMSSAHLVARVKRWSQWRKVGHAGTLDPFATGVMILLINQATRLAGFFLGGEKTYRATLRLGIETDTQDATGSVIHRRPIPNDLDRDGVGRMMAGFIGEQEQAPPVFSALKHHGVPLYKLARQGRPVQKPPRRIRIHALDIEEIRLPDIVFRVRCSAGTYIRTLSADMGNALGCGGHLSALRRTAACGFDEHQALGLEEIQRLTDADALAARLVPMTDALKALPQRVADWALTEKLKYGRILDPSDLWESEPTGADGLSSSADLKVLDTEGALLAVLHRDEPGGAIRYIVNFMTHRLGR